MDNKMNKWEELWKQPKANNIDIDKLTKQILKLEKITKYQRLLFLFILLFSSYSMFTHLSLNRYNVISFILIVIGFAFVLVPLFENRTNFRNKNTDQFIENQLNFLRKKILIPKVYLLIFMILFVIALNIAFLGAFNKLDNFDKILLHSFTFILFMVLLRLRKVGIKNYEKEILPILDKLEKIQKEE